MVPTADQYFFLEHNSKNFFDSCQIILFQQRHYFSFQIAETHIKEKKKRIPWAECESSYP